jgi:3-methyladenine DNA glycosylase AlkD
MEIVNEIKKELKSKSNQQRKKTNEWFFKTGKGEYGEGDKFIGLTVPDTKKVAKKYFQKIDLEEIKIFFQSEIHEERLLALVVLRLKYDQKIKSESKKDLVKRKKIIFNFYLKNLKYVNNWDLVDSSAQYIVGNYLFNFENRNIKLLLKLAKSKNLWEKRISIISCFYFITQKETKEFFQIAEILKNDKHDLIQKALGWMLREIYKRIDEGIVRKFLKENIKIIGRVTLRYAIEKMEIQERKIWLSL